MEIGKIMDNLIEQEFEKAKSEIGIEEFNKRFRLIENKPVLDFVNTIVLNLPGSCGANCSYCIDKQLRKTSVLFNKFRQSYLKAFGLFQNIKHLCITGGNLPYDEFNTIIADIRQCYDANDLEVTWNTNGIGLNVLYDTYYINFINLHLNSHDEQENQKIFASKTKPISIDEAKDLFGDKLNLRITIDEKFNIDNYAKFGVPLYLNRLLPGTEESHKIYLDTIQKLSLSKQIDRRRRNVYLTTNYNKIPIRICVGDKIAKHIPNRHPTWLNVCIVHRSGKVCGSWFEDDKFLFDE